MELQNRSEEKKDLLALETYLSTQLHYEIGRISSEMYVRITPAENPATAVQ